MRVFRLTVSCTMLAAPTWILNPNTSRLSQIAGAYLELITRLGLMLIALLLLHMQLPHNVVLVVLVAGKIVLGLLRTALYN